MGTPSASQNAIISSGQYIKTFKVMHKSQLQTLREGQALVSKKSTTKRGGTPCRNDKGASTPKSRKVIKDFGNKKNGRNEPVISPAHGTENASTPLFQGIKIYYKNRATGHFHGSHDTHVIGVQQGKNHFKN